jgi:regulatory subunit for Cdc7p protein kinase
LDGTGVTDLVQKAEALKIKVWTVKSESQPGMQLTAELNDMLARIIPAQTAAARTKNSLSHLLADERLHGTRERDVNAPRPDYYYFKPGSKHLLIEDATGKGRTIMVKEYVYGAKEIEYPELFTGFLKPSAAALQVTTSMTDLRDRAWALYVDKTLFKGELPPNDFRRSTSLRSMPITPKLPDAQPYQNASGNSVVLTSNIASTCNNVHANSPLLSNGMPALGTNKDRAIMQMSRRVQVLKGNARMAAKRQSDIPDVLDRRASTGNIQPVKTFMAQDQVIKMLQQARQPARENPDITYEMRLANRDAVDEGIKAKEQDTAAGYCENCRVRYSDLSLVSDLWELY